MGFYFRKRIKLAPGLYVNLSFSGISFTVGPRGGSVNFSPKKSSPKVGCSNIKLSDKSQNINEIHSNFILKVNDFGMLLILDENGRILSPSIIKKIKKDEIEAIYCFLKEAAADFNKISDQLKIIYYLTPSPKNINLIFPLFKNNYPKKPKTSPIYFYHHLTGLAKGIEDENKRQIFLFNKAVFYWQKLKDEYDKNKMLFLECKNHATLGNLSSMKVLLNLVLNNFSWANDTQIKYKFTNSQILYLNADLPNESSIPLKIASIAKCGYKLNIQDKTLKQFNNDFNHFIHGIMFRVIGEIFANLQYLQTIIISGFVQRESFTLGQTHDEYIISIKINRLLWEEINFTRLKDMDPVSALERFDPIKFLDKNGKLIQIEPIKFE